MILGLGVRSVDRTAPLRGRLRGLADVMKRLADGDTSAPIPATRAKDELGAMARAVVVFRDNMIERERLTATQAEDRRARASSAARRSP